MFTFTDPLPGKEKPRVAVALDTALHGILHLPCPSKASQFYTQQVHNSVVNRDTKLGPVPIAKVQAFKKKIGPAILFISCSNPHHQTEVERDFNSLVPFITQQVFIIASADMYHDKGGSRMTKVKSNQPNESTDPQTNP